MISVSIFSTVAILFYYGFVLMISAEDKYAPGTVVLVNE